MRIDCRARQSTAMDSSEANATEHGREAAAAVRDRAAENAPDSRAVFQCLAWMSQCGLHCQILGTFSAASSQRRSLSMVPTRGLPTYPVLFRPCPQVTSYVQTPPAGKRQPSVSPLFPAYSSFTHFLFPLIACFAHAPLRTRPAASHTRSAASHTHTHTHNAPLATRPASHTLRP